MLSRLQRIIFRYKELRADLECDIFLRLWRVTLKYPLQLVMFLLWHLVSSFIKRSTCCQKSRQYVNLFVNRGKMRRRIWRGILLFFPLFLFLVFLLTPMTIAELGQWLFRSAAGFYLTEWIIFFYHVINIYDDERIVIWVEPEPSKDAILILPAHGTVDPPSLQREKGKKIPRYTCLITDEQAYFHGCQYSQSIRNLNFLFLPFLITRVVYWVMA